MKDSKELQDYVSKLNCENEVDGLAIAQFIHNNYGISIDIPQYTPEKESTTYVQFKKWIDGDMNINKGDFIKFEPNDERPEVIAIVKKEVYGGILSDVLLIGDGIVLKDTVLKDSKFSAASPEDKKRLLTELNNRGLEWNENNHKVIEKYIPKNGDLIRFSSGGVSGVGLYSHSTPESTFMYAYKYDGIDGVVYDYRVDLGSPESISMHKATAGDKRDFMNSLNDEGKAWNGYMKRLEPLLLRAQEGESYWYINESFRAVSAKETGSSSDAKRSSAGNYFTNIEDVHVVIIDLHKSVNQIFAKPETKKQF
ncbi:MAG: hypothetical protein ACRDD8_05830 [Bacteroidales bacterium]